MWSDAIVAAAPIPLLPAVALWRIVAESFQQVICAQPCPTEYRLRDLIYKIDLLPLPCLPGLYDHIDTLATQCLLKAIPIRRSSGQRPIDGGLYSSLIIGHQRLIQLKFLFQPRQGWPKEKTAGLNIAPYRLTVGIQGQIDQSAGLIESTAFFTPVCPYPVQTQQRMVFC